MNALKDVIALFFPKICICCEEPLLKDEIEICLKCRYELPVTNYTNEINNEVEKVFYGRVKIEFATALLFYRKKGISQKILNQLKYRGNQNIGNLLGEWLGNELRECKRLQPVDYIVPVPLHPKKLEKRGYNQLSTFGKTLSKMLNVPYIETILTKKSATETQTLKLRFERWKNVNEIFDIVDTKIFENKHILLIDDVITTGATLESCALELLKTKNIKISIATMTFTD